MQPTLAQLERSGIPVRHIDVVAEPHLASRYGVRSTPTFIVVCGAAKRSPRLVGTQSLDQLQTALAINPSPARWSRPARSRKTLNEIPPRHKRGLPLSAGSIGRLDRAGRAASDRTESLIANSGSAVSRHSRAARQCRVCRKLTPIQRALAATVRLRVHDGHGYGAGTGTIIDTHGDEALVLTCGHLFRENQGQGKVEVDLFVSGETRTVERSRGRLRCRHARHRFGGDSPRLSGSTSAGDRPR